MQQQKYNKSKIIGIVIVLIIVFVAIGLLLSANGANTNKKAATPTPTPLSDIITFTINQNSGIDRIIYNNINHPGESIILTIIDLPYSGNCSRGDTLTFDVTVRGGFQWNTWKFSPVGRTNSDNTLTIQANDPLYCYNNHLDMTPSCVSFKISPIATPTPSPTISPTPTNSTSP
jgi:hypothetical protein